MTHRLSRITTRPGGGRRVDRARLQRLLRTRLLLVLLAPVLLFGWLVAVPAPAHADGLDDLCKTVPGPVRPDLGVAGLVMDKPDLKTVPDAAPDPFKDPKVPIADVYGWAWRYTNYDLGCGNDFIRDPGAVASTNIANTTMAYLTTLTSGVASLENMARTATLDWLNPVVTAIGGTLRDRILTVWLPLALLVLSVVVGFAAIKASYAETFRRLWIVLACVLLAVVTLVFPAKATEVMNKAAATVADAAQAGFNSEAADLITRESVYKTWLVGNFGSADSPVATEYGPRLMSALTYTWSDVKRMQATPSAKTSIDKAKATEFQTIADEVKKKDPAAYQSLTGKTDTRTATTVLGILWVLMMGFFVAVAALITVLARLIMLGLVVAGMLGAVVGIVHFPVLQRLWDLFTAALLNLAKFTIAGAVMTLVLGAISNAPIGVGWRLLIAIIATVLAIMITKPIASFKAMAGMNPNRSVLGGLFRRAAGTVLGMLVSQKLINRKPSSDEPEPTDEQEAPRPQPQPVEPPMPSLPPPPPLRALPAGVWRQQEASRAGWAGAETFWQTGDTRRSLPPAPVPGWPDLPAADAPRPRALPVGTSPAPPPAAPGDAPDERPLGVRPIAAEQTRLLPPGGLPAGPSGGIPGVPAVNGAGATPQPVPQPVWGPGGGAAVAPAAVEEAARRDEPLVMVSAEPLPTAAGSVASGGPTDTGGARTAGTANGGRAGGRAGVTPEGAVVYPTGVIIQQDPTLYRSGSAARAEGDEYVKLPEPQIDANGEETWSPVYHSRAGTR